MCNNQLRYNLFMDIVQGNTQTVIGQIETDNIDLEMSLNGFDWSLLHTSAYNGHLDLVQYLLSKGSVIDSKNKSGMTAKELALRKGFDDIVQLIEDYESKEIAGCVNSLEKTIICEYNDFMRDE